MTIAEIVMSVLGAGGVSSVAGYLTARVRATQALEQALLVRVQHLEEKLDERAEEHERDVRELQEQLTEAQHQHETQMSTLRRQSAECEERYHALKKQLIKVQAEQRRILRNTPPIDRPAMVRPPRRPAVGETTYRHRDVKPEKVG